MVEKLKAPFPYFGGKSKVAGIVWEAIGDVPNYVEPFFGSGAVLLGRPSAGKTETVNDADGMLCNFWRAVANDPDGVANYADWPVNECDLHARHLWLVGQRDSLANRLMGDPDFYDCKAAGWWCWGLCCWIGSGWCSGKGPWHSVNGVLVDSRNDGQGVWKQQIHLGDNGQGIIKQSIHLGDNGRGICQQGVSYRIPRVGNSGGEEVICKIGRGGIHEWFERLRARLQRVRVACGDWKRVVTETPTIHLGLTGIFLDPPYGEEDREECYQVDSRSVAGEVLQWCQKNGKNPLLRIVLAGYSGEHEALEAMGWRVHAWKANGGFSNQGQRGNLNAKRERLWFSPNCLGKGNAQKELNFKSESESESD
jgi:hypothetical protein